MYLREHAGYKETCANAGVGGYSELYADFGDVHKATDGDDLQFWDWWKAKGAYLFAEPTIARSRILEAGTVVQSNENWITVELPLTMPLPVVVRQLRKQLGNRFAKANTAGLNPQRPPRYAVATRFVLSSLYMHLKVWQLRNEYPDIPLHEIADKAGLRINVRDLDPLDKVVAMTIRAAKSTLVSRHLRIARQYIDAVAQRQPPWSEFPKRLSR